jgi:hypothetical protein
MASIGEPVPKGVVHVAHDFVGVHRQEVNVRHEIARLRKQVKLLRRRVENLGLMPTRPLPWRAYFGVAVAVGLSALYLAFRTNNRTY